MNDKMDNKIQLIAFCGLYCGECFAYKGKIADLSRDLRKELRQAKCERLAPNIPFKEFRNYKESYECMGALVRLRCKKACRGNGGNPFCTIRKCCRKKEIIGCWECDDIEICKKLDSLKGSHNDAHIKNLRKLKMKGVEEFISGKKYW